MAGEAAQLRFAVLHHTGVPDPHYDLLIETSPHALLLTFRCERWPLQDGDTLSRQPDHRRIYLDYQGQISGGRGEVMQIASGPCRILNQPASGLSVALTSASGTQTIALHTHDGTQWQVTGL